MHQTLPRPLWTRRIVGSFAHIRQFQERRCARLSPNVVWRMSWTQAFGLNSRTFSKMCKLSQHLGSLRPNNRWRGP